MKTLTRPAIAVKAGVVPDDARPGRGGLGRRPAQAAGVNALPEPVGGGWRCRVLARMVVVLAFPCEGLDRPIEPVAGRASDHGGFEGPIAGAHGKPVPHLGREPASEGAVLVEGGRAVEEHHLIAVNHCRNRFGWAARAFVICCGVVRVHRGLLRGVAGLWQVAGLVSVMSSAAAGFTIASGRRVPPVRHLVTAAAPAPAATPRPGPGCRVMRYWPAVPRRARRAARRSSPEQRAPASAGLRTARTGTARQPGLPGRPGILRPPRARTGHTSRSSSAACLPVVEYGFHRSGPFCAVWLGTRAVRATVMFRVLGAAGRPRAGHRAGVAWMGLPGCGAQPPGQALASSRRLSSLVGDSPPAR